MTKKQFKKKIKKMAKKAWKNMGHPGNDNYFEKATREQLHYSGRFRALEDVLDILEEVKPLDWNKEMED